MLNKWEALLWKVSAYHIMLMPCPYHRWYRLRGISLSKIIIITAVVVCGRCYRWLLGLVISGLSQHEDWQGMCCSPRQWSLYVHPTIHTYWRWDGGTVLRGCGFIRQPSPRQSPLFYDFSSVLIKCIFFFFFINVKLILVYCILRKSSSLPATSPAEILSPRWTELELD